MGEQDRGKAYTGSIQDNNILPFFAENAGVNGRVARFGGVIDDLLEQHGYPEPVSKLLGEAVVLISLIGSALKFDGKLILQTQSEGPVDLLVVQYISPGTLRGYARFDDEKIKEMTNGREPSSAQLLGKGHLAMTIDQGPEMDRYQGIVALDGGTLADVAHDYFEQSEQLPSFLRLAVARHYVAGEGDDPGHWQWRAGGIMIQDLTKEGGASVDIDEDADDIDDMVFDEDGWNRALHLASTVEDHELLDPMLAPEHLIYRLFHEERVRVFESKPVINECGCSREHIYKVIMQFSSDDIEHMIEDGRIVVTCEFCSTKYFFKEDEF